MLLTGVIWSFPSLGYAFRYDSVDMLHTTRQFADALLHKVLDIIRAAVFQKALDSTRKIAPANLPETLPAAAFWVIFTDAWAFLSIALPKLGIGLLIIRLFRPPRWLRISIMILCIALNVLAIVGFIITFVQCNPAAGQWDPFRNPQTRCWNRAVQIIYSCTVSGTCLEAVSYDLPLVRKLKCPTQAFPHSWTLRSPSILASSSGACRCRHGRSLVRWP